MLKCCFLCYGSGLSLERELFVLCEICMWKYKFSL